MTVTRNCNTICLTKRQVNSSIVQLQTKHDIHIITFPVTKLHFNTGCNFHANICVTQGNTVHILKHGTLMCHKQLKIKSKHICYLQYVTAHHRADWCSGNLTDDYLGGILGSVTGYSKCWGSWFSSFPKSECWDSTWNWCIRIKQKAIIVNDVTLPADSLYVCTYFNSPSPTRGSWATPCCSETSA